MTEFISISRVDSELIIIIVNIRKTRDRISDNTKINYLLNGIEFWFDRFDAILNPTKLKIYDHLSHRYKVLR